MPTFPAIGPIGVLLVNLGTPDQPEVPEVRKYLRQFLMDGRVIDIPFLNRFALVNLIIAPFRAPKSTKIYKKLWTKEGSPIKIHGVAVAEQLQHSLGNDYVVELAMRYQNPSIGSAIARLKTKGLRKIIVLPLFPQYASASTGSVHEEVMRLLSKWEVIPELHFISSFFDWPGVTDTFASIAKSYMEKEQYDYILFSYHGIPERQIKKGDCTNTCLVNNYCCDTLHSYNALCYRAQCYATTRLLVEKLGLQEGTYTSSFQSRLGSTPWIKPYSDHVITQLAKEGKKKLLVFSPAFIADCLETTIEIGEEYHELFREHGGEKVQLVDSLNQDPRWVEALKQRILSA
jgi:ferrochelatase